MPSGVYIRTKETKQILSKARKGRHFPKLSKAMMGRKVSDGTRLKMSVAHRGIIKSLEERQAISKRNIGNKYNLGKKRSLETKLKMSRSMKGNNLGNKPSAITRVKMSIAHKGSKAYNWKGGITPTYYKLRHSLKTDNWRRQIYRRDKFTCQKCGSKKSGTLNAHHIYNFSEFPDLRYLIKNGITLCKVCHTSFHKKYGVRNNNAEQLNEFFTDNFISNLK